MKAKNHYLIKSKVSTDKLDFKFSYWDGTAGTSQLSYTFKINPANAKDIDSLTFAFADIKTQAIVAANSWSIDDANISFSIHADSTTAGYSADGVSVISFGPMDMRYSGSCSRVSDSECDIKLNSLKKWILPDEEMGNHTVPVVKILAHEMGHSAGLWDLIDVSYNDQLMYNQSNGQDWGIEDPQYGDKAGAVYCRPSPGGTIGFNQLWPNVVDVTLTDTINIPSGKLIEVESNADVYIPDGKEIDVSGTLTAKSGAEFTKVSGGTYWSGIDLQSGGTLDVDGDITIEYATCGIDFYGGSVTNSGNTITVQNCSSIGVAINSTYSPTVQNIDCDNCGSYYGGIMKAGTTNNPIINYCTVDDSYHGLYIAGNATVDYCDFKTGNDEDTITFASTSTVNLDGNNNICPGVGEKAINNRTDSSIDAENNWWGTSSPTDALFTFSAYVDYSPYRGSAASAGIYKPAINNDPLEIAEHLEISGDYSGAISRYLEMLQTETDPGWKKFLITSILRAHDHYDRNYDDIKKVVAGELENAEGYYEAALYYIACDILVREGKYQESIEGLLTNANGYSGTSMEAEMLSRVAEIYGVHLNDKGKALEFAEKAAELNPGQLILRSAYNAADIEYDPSLYTDKFKDIVENLYREPETEELASDVVENSLSASPNPFNPITTITYSIAKSSPVTLSVYSVTGQKVATLVDGPVRAGTHTATFDGAGLASGVYF